MNNLHSFVVLAYKESDKLEECIKSVLNQETKTNVIIATSTPNSYISSIASVYNLKVVVNEKANGIGEDFNFALNCVDSELVTIAHQDDIYEKNYVTEIIKMYNSVKDKDNIQIIFTDYYEIKNENKEYKNLNLKIKRILLFPIRLKKKTKSIFSKRNILRFGNAICCPSVTFMKKNIPSDLFDLNLDCNIDWCAWEKLSKRKGYFCFINKMLMGHRISGHSTTTKLIKINVRNKEDYKMYKKFWPTPIAKFLNKIYKNSEKNNDIKELTNRILYITEDYQKYKNKINAEVKSLSKLDLDPYIISTNKKDSNVYLEVYHYKDSKFNLEESKVILTTKEKIDNNYNILNLLKRIKYTMKLDKIYKKEVIANFNKNNYDYCYMRRIGFFIIFFRKMIKKLSKKSKIIYEIPTYPMDKYDSFLVNFSQVIEEIYFNLFIKKYITIIPVILQKNVKLDKKMFEIRNGIDYEIFNNKIEEHKTINKKIRFVSVAHVQKWHGYDRFIKSLALYNGEYDISLVIYGDTNNEVERLKKLAKDLKVENKIIFPGKISIDKLIKESENYDIGLGGLGYYIRKSEFDTSIKNREFCAMGLPFVCATKDLSFKEDFKYLYRVSNDSNSFDFNDIIKWYESLNKKIIKKEMKEYAKEELSFYKLYEEMFKKIG